ncbi:phage head closure protein [Prosthecomicrobium sp. N25]|uniref:phage head closure protein n=1 Tax=Prosthecomicrobium sp. N25 TaxID=3129254 RepID=UPI00307852B7
MSGPPVPLGRLRHRLVLQSSSVGSGGDTVWTTVATLWAAVVPTGAEERESAGRGAGVVTHRITLRFRAGLSSAHRLVQGSRVFRILAVQDHDERHRYHLVLAEEEPA